MESYNFRMSSPFYDDINYPRGFNKHGDFTFKEAQILEDYGRILIDLSTGKKQPESKDEIHFTKVSNGDADAINCVERTWLKYTGLIGKDSVYHGVFPSNYKTGMVSKAI